MVTRWRRLVPLLLATVGAFELRVRRTAPPRMMAEPPATFPQRDELGIDGCRSVVVVYREDTANRVRQTLAEFERTAEDYASRGCILVALRATPLAGFEDRFPAFQFKKGLERLTKLRAALGHETYQQVVDAALKVDKTADRHQAAAAHRAALALKVT